MRNSSAKPNRQEETRSPDRQDPGADRARPFDTRELEKLPSTNDNDPPYRPWWVIDTP